MTPDRWRQIQDLFAEARAHRSGERAAFLEKACAGDNDLRQEVEWMLAHQDEAERFIPKPALDAAAAALAADRVATLAGTFLGQTRTFN
jgi:serine/threonine-protein kinase